jgi:hypothetical protein
MSLMGKKTVEELGAIGVHHTPVDKTGSWDAGANLKRMGDSPSKAALHDMHAWVDDSMDQTKKSAYKLPHHNVNDNGTVGAANMSGVESAMGRLNGGGLDIPAEDRAGVHSHLAAHYKDAGMEAPELKSSAEGIDPLALTGTDYVTNFLTLVMGNKEKALTAKAQILAALVDPKSQSTLLDVLRKDAGGAQFFGAPAAKMAADGDCPECDGTGKVDGETCPECGGTGEAPDAQFVASTANDKDGTIDCVWYGGATVPRIDQESGDPYMLNLDMDGCRMGRLNAGAPIFDTHFTGDDFKSILANLVSGKIGTKAQVGVVQKAWSDGPKGMATLQFDTATPDGAELYRKAKTGIVRNLSFGAWIYKKEKQSPNQAPTSKVSAQTEGPGAEGRAPDISAFTATDWEPFEISPVTIPADFTTQFLSAQPHGQGQAAARATSPMKEQPVEPNTQDAGVEARQKEVQLAATAAADSAVKSERLRVADITARATKFLTVLGQPFVQKFVDEGKTADEFSIAALAALAEKGQMGTDGTQVPIQGDVTITRDGRQTVREQMEASILFRLNSNFYSDWGKAFNHEGVEQHFHRDDSDKHDRMKSAQKELAAKSREFANYSLIDMARECLSMSGVQVKRLSNSEIAERALKGAMPETMRPREYGDVSFFGGGAETTSDFPSILANVANKTLRQAYEAYPRTFQPFCRQVTAQDFKPINRVQLSDAPTLKKLNEKGEYTRANLSDTNQSYSLQTFGKITSITRKAIINDDLNAFTRVPGLLGVSAAQMESDTVWAVLTSNQVMGEDGLACFVAGHNNYFTGAGSALALGAAIPPTGLTQGRAKMRQQTAQNGTHLNLIPRFVLVPTVLETTLLQMIAPLNIASTDVTKVVPEWVRSTVPVVEPRLDANSTTGWYVVADPAQIDTIEYCYLEGQTGVYIETRQGWEIDGVEIKCREDFAAAALDFRGLQFNAGV